ncbi:PmoA family protein [Paenibacillus sp. MBLB4367]|uniref:DUF6807 domain-containing protein n=1 Tax=Paenibacillus sp. MBLB4367 TaxID=3384767 RepID=UPI00390812B5
MERTFEDTSLYAIHADEGIRICRSGQDQPIVAQQAAAHKRPYIHPIVAPDGRGTLTENAPPHHPWQHGLYVGLNQVNGIGFWEEGLLGNPADGSFHPKPLAMPWTRGNRAGWHVETDWHSPEGDTMLTERQEWSLEDCGSRYHLDLMWTLSARVDLVFGQYAYGGLFLRMPYLHEAGGEAVNDRGQANQDAEAQAARWVAVSMPIEGREDWAGIAIMDDPGNPEHPVRWRVDGQLGIAPSRCIAGDWRLAKGQSQTFRYRSLVYTGRTDAALVQASWDQFAGGDRG